MYSCDEEHTATRAASSASYQPCVAAARSPVHHSAQPGQVPAAVDGSAAAQPRRAKSKHLAARPSSTTSRRRSSTTMVATDVSNFRAMVQELTGFPAAAIFRPLPRRVHAASTLSAGSSGGSGAGSGGALHGHSSSDTATTAGNHSSGDGVLIAQPLTSQQQSQCAPPGVFDGLSDIGSPEFDSWPDFNFPLNEGACIFGLD